MRVYLVLLAGSLLWVDNPAARADLPRTLLSEPPQIRGRPVKELVLTGTVPVGELLPPGLPTTITYKMTPNRFRPVAEDAEGVYYQAVDALQKHVSWDAGWRLHEQDIPRHACPVSGRRGGRSPAGQQVEAAAPGPCAEVPRRFCRRRES